TPPPNAFHLVGSLAFTCSAIFPEVVCLEGRLFSFPPFVFGLFDLGGLGGCDFAAGWFGGRFLGCGEIFGCICRAPLLLLRSLLLVIAFRI
ncbi:TPA: hypothetical protein ACU8BU_002333, partial [Neisseria subflava]